MRLERNKEELLIGLISDTHVPSRTSSVPEQILKDFQERNVDYVFHMGDFTSYEVYSLLIDLFGENKVIAVRGNMDAGSKRLMNILPETIELEIFDHKIFMTHGSGGPHMIIRRLNKTYDLSPYDIVIFGHTHHPKNELNEKDGRLYVNPGTCTPIDGRLTVVSTYGFLKISINDASVEIVNLK
ncbi:MAG: metallophosphoesterase family protein [Candidatus Lokiarchaeota archaeon]|nr:metallophosphoesterase family protein [Candidatus Lokiarchaeota archaeon]